MQLARLPVTFTHLTTFRLLDAEDAMSEKKQYLKHILCGVHSVNGVIIQHQEVLHSDTTDMIALSFTKESISEDNTDTSLFEL